MSLLLVLVAVTMLSIASCRRDDAGTLERPGSSATGLAGLSAAARVGDMAARRALAESARARVPPRLPMPAADSGPLGAHRPAELDQAARRVIGFLRGEVGFDRIRLADTVTLYVSPEGGGTRTKRTREQLRDRSNWKARGLLEYSFVPPTGTPTLTTRVGRHFNCGEQPLSSTFEELARLPHAGTMLRYGTASCLQTWNLTLVFDPNERPPMLVAAVYDQYEW